MRRLNCVVSLMRAHPPHRRARRANWLGLAARLSLPLLLFGCVPGTEGTDGPAPATAYSSPVVLFVSPDSAELAAFRERLGDDDFYTVADDAMWYRSAAYTLLDSLRIPHAEVGRSSARFLVDGRPQPFAWVDVPRPWFLVVYDGVAQPTIVPDIDLRDELARLVEGLQR